jgi:hypothetical protein
MHPDCFEFLVQFEKSVHADCWEFLVQFEKSVHADCWEFLVQFEKSIYAPWLFWISAGLPPNTFIAELHEAHQMNA